MNGQKKLSNMIEKYSCNVSFIFTVSSIDRIIPKIKSLVCKINYKSLSKNEFKSAFNHNFKNFFEDDEIFQNNKKYILDKFYQIYLNNEHNIGNTLHQINFLYLNEKINKKELGKKINLMSIYNQLSIQMLNMLIQSKKLSDYTMIRSKLYKYNTLNLDKIMLVKKILQNIASIDNMDNELKHEIMSLGNDFSKSYTKSDKSIIVLETFIIHLWKKLNNF